MDLTNILKNKKLTNLVKAETSEEKEKKKYEDYKRLKSVGASRSLQVTKIRKYKIIDVINNKTFMQLTVGLEDYDGKKDKFIYIASMNIDNKDTPRLYEFVDKEVSRLSADY